MIIKKNTGLKISLLSSELVKIFSSGEILNSRTLNYKDLIPEEEGLFCEKIFGAIDKKCYCGKTTSYHDFNFLCDYCGVETSLRSLNLRRIKLGHIKLNDYFLNSLYYKISPYYLSTILNVSKSDINNLLYFGYYLIIYSSLKFISAFDIIKSEIYFKNKNKSFYNIHGISGIESIKYLLNNIDLFSELKRIKLNLKLCDNLILKKRYIKRYKILRKFFNSNIKLTSILLKNILVLPPDLRPIVNLPDDTFVSSDLNELYKRIINSNLRLKKLKKYFYAPSFFFSNERKNIQENIDYLFLGGAKTGNNKKLKSISENLKGKNGYFRKNLLGKRVDYSARAVIVSGAHLKMGECAIPKHLAFELFRPFIYSKILLNKDLNIKIAKFEVDRQTDYAFLILSKIIKNKYVVLNRAPSLHRLNIQAFKVLLTNDKAIKLHPLVCASYNADFDGDQMAIHIPITFRSSIEYKTLLFSNNNILYPSNGTCCISPTKDIILGIYYSSKLNYFDLNNNIFFFNNFSEVIIAYIYNIINYNTIIYFRLKEFNNKTNNFVYKIYKTNLCRVFIYKFFFNYPFFNLNKVLKRSDICKIIDSLSINKNSNFIISLSDQLMNIGFNFITKSGFSISLDDMFFSYNKKNIFNISNNIFISHNLNYFNFMITKSSKKLKIFNLWDKTCNLLSNLVFKDLSFSNYIDNNNIFLKIDSFNFLYMMMDAGARGSESQILQICSNRGLINFKKSGIFEIPVLSNLREGLSILEYFYFSYNSRKTLADTALKTSSAGYLTRRLVESSNNVFISEFDCGTTKGLNFKSLIKDGDVIKDFYDRIFGRVLLYDFVINGEILLKKNYLIDNNSITILKKNNIFNIYIRSPIKCISKIGMCSLCYGIDLSRNRIVDVGEMVGIVAAQSIGEPGTQLTMRTFHSGGVVNKHMGKSFFKSNSEGYLKFPSSFKTVKNGNNLEIVISRHNRLQIINNLKEELESFFIPYSSYIFFKNNSYVKKGDIISKWNSNYDFIISEYKGYIKFINFIKGFNYINRFEDNCVEIINSSNKPQVNILDFNKKVIYNKSLCSGNIICYNDLDLVDIGDIIIKTPKKIMIAEDIIGGLPKIDNLFEARTPNNPAIISPFDGIVNYKDINGKKYIFISRDKKILFSKFINFKNVLNFSNNQEVKKGDFLTSGPINPNDILFVYGVDHLVEFLLKEIKYIYFSQGVEINDKHIEIILNQMLQFGCITNPGKSNFLIGEILSISSIEKMNKNFDKFSKIKYNITLLGITSKSLKIDSFLSAASFQRTEQILSDAAIRCSYDNMRLLKNVVMVGKIFESGSGVYDKILKR